MPSSLVIDRSALGIRGSVSVAVLLPGVGSVVPVGGLTVAVLVRRPVAEGLIWTVKVKVTVALTGRSTVVDRTPVPLSRPVTTPPPVAPANAQLPPVAKAGRGSDTLAPVTALGPWLVTTMV